jgi:dolichol-phosphate mannosyltransferase
LGRTYEVVLINDGSRDRTWEVMRGLSERDPNLVCVNLSRNHGHQLALTAGLTVCRGDRILILDADLQDPPELLPDMLRTMAAQGADAVYGQRRKRAGEGTGKLLTAWVFYRLIDRLSDVRIPHDTGDFRLMSRRALDALLSMPERHRFIRGMVSWIGFRQVPFLYDRDARFAGTTKYPLRKMIAFAVDAITGFSVKPLALAGLAGTAAAVAAAALALFSVVTWFTGANVVGWTSLMAGMSALSAVQLFVLAIMGEYLGRLYEQSKGRPLFLIESVVRGAESDDRGAAVRQNGASTEHGTPDPGPVSVAADDLKRREQEFHDEWAASTDPGSVLVDESWEAATCPERR